MPLSGIEKKIQLAWSAEPRPLRAAEPVTGAAVIGTYRGVRGPEALRISSAQRYRGLYISGKPRTGKSTVILNFVVDDFRRGNAACVIDPHGELIAAILERLPLRTQHDLDRVMVVDPTNLERPIGIDLLDASNPFEQDQAVQFMIEMIERTTPDFARGPMLYQGIRNGMRLLFETGGRLTDLPELLTSREFLKSRLDKIGDPLLRRYWQEVWPALLRGSDGPGFIAYMTSKFSQFLDDRCLRNIFGQRGGLDFRQAIDGGRLLLIDLARGKLGALNSQLLGLIILHCIERAVMRATIAGGASLYIDEVHEFDVENLRRMVTAFPKQRAALVLANQSVGDLRPGLRSTILGSVGTFLLLRQGIEAAPTLEALTQPRFDDRDLMSLRDHEAICRVDAGGPQRLCRVALASPPPVVNDPGITTQLREYAARRIGRAREEVEAELFQHLSSGE